jgi:hypothetical protein
MNSILFYFRCSSNIKIQNEENSHANGTFLYTVSRSKESFKYS